MRALAGAAERLAQARENGTAEFRLAPVPRVNRSTAAAESTAACAEHPAARPAAAEPSRPRSALVPDLHRASDPDDLPPSGSRRGRT